MARENDGGSAFPVRYGSHGMSLRDYFAAKAMAAYITSSTTHLLATYPSKCAEWAYVQADAMIAAREKGGQTT